MGSLHHRRTRLEAVDVRVSPFIQSAGSKLPLLRLDFCEAGLGVQIKMCGPPVISKWMISDG